MAIQTEHMGCVAKGRQHGPAVNQLRFNTSPGGGEPNGDSKDKKIPAVKSAPKCFLLESIQTASRLTVHNTCPLPDIEASHG